MKIEKPERRVRVYVDTNVWILAYYRPEKPENYLAKHERAQRFWEYYAANQDRMTIVMSKWGFLELLEKTLELAQDNLIVKNGILPTPQDLRQARDNPKFQLSPFKKRELQSQLAQNIHQAGVSITQAPFNTQPLARLVRERVQLSDAIHLQQAQTLHADYLITEDHDFTTRATPHQHQTRLTNITDFLNTREGNAIKRAPVLT